MKLKDLSKGVASQLLPDELPAETCADGLSLTVGNSASADVDDADGGEIVGGGSCGAGRGGGRF